MQYNMKENCQPIGLKCPHFPHHIVKTDGRFTIIVGSLSFPSTLVNLEVDQ